jgi:hypothetical protein
MKDQNTEPKKADSEHSKTQSDSVHKFVSRGMSGRTALVMISTFRWNYRCSMILRTPFKFWDNREVILESFFVVLALLALPIFWLCDVVHLITQPLWYPFTCKLTDAEIATAKKVESKQSKLKL